MQGESTEDWIWCKGQPYNSLKRGSFGGFCSADRATVIEWMKRVSLEAPEAKVCRPEILNLQSRFICKFSTINFCQSQCMCFEL